MGCWLGLRALKTLYFYFCRVLKKLKKNKLKGFLQRILQEIMNKIILGTSGAWSMRRSSHQPSDPVIILKIVGFYMLLVDCGTSSSRPAGLELEAPKSSLAPGRI